ncbi:S9 family peptidase [Sphingomonas sp. TF3]|uniref:S9 family peptidase n=1 Tax=Sphingomonas sp. TF3 TaxID=2495580 RepID=UPI000F865520|nr:alpha/beta fold hydrolase [Sphingomonas sp. TF3]RUN75064.1 S9 family peptidase [Sphingomonas sp. TF3]
MADNLAATLALPIASGLVGAADTPRFAWVENAGGVRNIWVSAGGRPARAITAFTDDDGQQLSDLALTRDGARVAFVRGGDPEFPDGSIPNTAASATPPKQQLFITSATGGVAELVGEGHAPVFAPDGERLAYTRKGEIWLWSRTAGARRVASVVGEVSRLEWSPEGSQLLFVDERGDHSFIALLDVAARGEARLRYLDPGLGFGVDPCFAPDGKSIAYIRFVDPPATATDNSGRYWSIRSVELATGSARTLWAAPTGAGGAYAGTRARNLFWTTHGTIVFPWERSGWLHAYALDPVRGTARDLTPGAFELESFLLSSDGKALVYAANAGDLERRHIWTVPLAGGAATRLTKGAGSETIPTFAGTTLAVLATSATQLAHPALVGDAVAPLHDAPSVAGFTVPETVTFTAEDGVLVHAQLFHARGPGRHPALVYVHGGPRRQMLPGFNSSYYYSNAYILNQHFAAKGYDVLSVNYRSGTGYGHDFREAPGQARGGASEYRDVQAAGKWLAARSDVDPARIGIWGGSWGGYLTALALARNSDLFAAGVDFHGVHAMVRPVEKTLSPDAEAAAHQLQWQSSPLGAIASWRSPVLLIHGDDDKSVDFYQSLLLARELTARQVPFEQLVFPDERHDFFRYADWLASYRATDDFLDRTLMHKVTQ